jgi:dTDP-6-deoxy-L-talose 4-dehydrogenase (NAD+)
LKKKSILITGATGFVGRPVLRSLLHQNIIIKVIVRKKSLNKIPFCNKIIPVITKNIFKESVNWWKKHLKGVDIIVHLAWNLDAKNYRSSQFNIECLQGSLNMISAAIKTKVRRIISVGTCLEYEESINFLSTKSPLRGSCLYSFCKISLFNIASAILKLHKKEFVWCRLFHLFGKHEKLYRLSSQIKYHAKRKKIFYLQNKSSEFDFMNVEDAAIKIMRISLGKKTGAFNICSGKSISVFDYAKSIASKIGAENIIKYKSDQRKKAVISIKKILGAPSSI